MKTKDTDALGRQS